MDLLNDPKLVVKNGMLYFKDLKEFNEVYNLLQKDRLKFQQIEKIDFICAKEAYEETSRINSDKQWIETHINHHVSYWFKDETGENTLLRKIVNPAYEVLFNHRGAIQIGDNIFKHDKGIIYIFKSLYFHRIDDVAKIPELIKININKKIIEKTIIDECSYVYAWKNNKQWKKLRGYVDIEAIVDVDVYGQYIVFYTGKYFYTTENFKRGLFGSFYASDANEVRVTGTGPGQSFDFFFTNKDAVTYGFFGQLNCIHSVIDDGNSGSCSN